jgi:hypothetical protein
MGLTSTPLRLSSSYAGSYQPGGHSSAFATPQSAFCPFETSQACRIFSSEMIFWYRTSGLKRSSMEEEK